MTDPIDINACFDDYFSTLYSSRAHYTLGELCEFLDGVSLPVLSASARESLDAPITLEDFQQALGSLQLGKTPNSSGFGQLDQDVSTT